MISRIERTKLSDPHPFDFRSDLVNMSSEGGQETDLDYILRYEILYTDTFVCQMTN